MALTTAPQNELLGQIIVLLGGTVRDPHKQNWLLEDWRDAIKTIQALFSTGQIGLTVDANGGQLANSRVAAATFTDYNLNVHNCLDNEIRFTGGRREQNKFHFPSETDWGAQAKVSPNATVIDLIDGPEGATKAIEFATTVSGNNQLNIAVTADTQKYMYSFWAKPGVATTKVKMGLVGINGVDTASLDYFFDTGILSQPGWKVMEATYNGETWYKFSRIFTNNGAGTLLIYQLSADGDTGDLVTTGQSLAPVYSDSPTPYEYVPKDMGVINNSGIENVEYFDTKKPENYLAGDIWGDSMVGQGSTDKLYLYIGKKFGVNNNFGLGGESTTDGLIRFSATSDQANRLIVLWWDGESDAVQYMANIAAMVALIPHDNYVVVTVLGKYIDKKGSPEHDTMQAINDGILSTYPNNSADVHTVLVNSYDPEVPQEVIDFNDDVIVPRLQPDGTHLNQDGVDISNPIIWAVLENKSWDISLPLSTSMLSEDIDDISIPLAVGTNFIQAKGFAVFEWLPGFDSDTVESSLLSIFDGSGLITDSATIDTLATTDGANTEEIAAIFSDGDNVKISVIWDDSATSLSIGRSINGGAWTWSDGLYDGAFTTGADINIFYSNTKTSNLKSSVIYDSLVSDDVQSTKDWVVLNA